MLPRQGSPDGGHRDVHGLPGHHGLHGRQVGRLHREEGGRLQASQSKRIATKLTHSTYTRNMVRVGHHEIFDIMSHNIYMQGQTKHP